MVRPTKIDSFSSPTAFKIPTKGSVIRSDGWVPPMERTYSEPPARSQPRILEDGSFDFEEMTLGDRMIYMRNFKNMKQSDLARRTGVTQAAISNLENNLLTPGSENAEEKAKRALMSADELKAYRPTAEEAGRVGRGIRRPRGNTLLAIAQELGVVPEWLLNGRGDPFKYVRENSSPADELKNLFDQMPVQQQEAILTMMRAWKT